MDRSHFEPPILGCCYESDEPFPHRAFFVTGFFTPYFQSRFKEKRAKIWLEGSCNRETTNGKPSSMEQSGEHRRTPGIAESLVGASDLRAGCFVISVLERYAENACARFLAAPSTTFSRHNRTNEQQRSKDVAHTSKDDGRGMGRTLASSTLSLLFGYGNRGGLAFISSNGL
jgi:hypothetical protein